MCNPHVPILLVEDDRAHAALIQWCLESQPAAVYHARDGEEALDYLLQRSPYADPTDHPRPHLVMLDLNLPKISGFDVLRQMKASPTLCSIPVAIISTSNSQDDIRQAYALGAVSYIVKPTEFEAFVTAIETLCKNWLEQKGKA